MEEKELLRLIKKNYNAIAGDLLISKEVEEIKDSIEKFLDEKLVGKDLISLAYRKFRSGAERRQVLWSDAKGLYPRNGLEYINQWLKFFEQYLDTKKIKNRLDDENLWVESHVENGEEHLFIGDKKDHGQHVHVIRGRTGELRIDEKDLGPQYLASKVESTLEVTLVDGRKIRSVKGILEFAKDS